MALYLVDIWAVVPFAMSVTAKSPKEAVLSAYSMFTGREARAIPRRTVDDISGIRGRVRRSTITPRMLSHGISAVPFHPTWNFTVKRGNHAMDVTLEKVQ